MKQIINFILSALAPFASVPTGWAIYAGMTEQPAFPILEPIAIIGAVAVITTTAAAALLVVDVLKHNQEAQSEEERRLNISVWSAWAILIGCIAGEILLSLIIVVIPGLLAYGVLAFPLMTLAGVFAFAMRMSLGERMQQREALRAKYAKEAADLKAKQEAADALAAEKSEQERARVRELRRSARESKRSAAQVIALAMDVPAPTMQSVAPANGYPRKCEHCEMEIRTPQSVGAHMKKHHPELCKPSKSLAVGLFEKASKQ